LPPYAGGFSTPKNPPAFPTESGLPGFSEKNRAGLWVCEKKRGPLLLGGAPGLLTRANQSSEVTMYKSESVTLRAGGAVAKDIPVQYLSAKVDECQSAVRPSIEKWLESPSLGLWFWGKSRCGKSQTACAVALELFRRGQDVLAVSYWDLFYLLRDHKTGHLSREALLDSLAKPSVLVLDEISYLLWLWPLAPLLRPVFKARAEAKKPTIVTSSISISDYVSFCDCEALDYLSEFKSLQFLEGVRWDKDLTLVASRQLVIFAEMMMAAGWLSEQERNREALRRLDFLKTWEVVFGEESQPLVDLPTEDRALVAGV
jgi:hypothetical protein